MEFTLIVPFRVVDISNEMIKTKFDIDVLKRKEWGRGEAFLINGDMSKAILLSRELLFTGINIQGGESKPIFG